MEKEFILDNCVRISDKEFRTYLGQCDKKLSKYPTIVLSFGETFAEKARTISSILGAIGIKVHESNLNNALGNLKFKRNEDSIINSRTGKRERKVFYQITLARMENLQSDEIKDYTFSPIEKAKVIKDEEPLKNELKISKNSLDFYLGQCNLDFQNYDQLILSTVEENLEMVKYMIKLFSPLGIKVDDEYIDTRNKQIFFHVTERERINERTGRKERIKFYKLGLTKVPELFMFTELGDAVEIE